MATLLIALGLVLVSIAGLSLGVLLGGRPLPGSCGGITCIKGIDCAACPKGALHHD